jgi:hypothetical protein
MTTLDSDHTATSEPQTEPKTRRKQSNRTAAEPSA